jgi:palmitoyltransferase
LNFSFATSIFTAYIVASDLFFVIKASASSNLDPHLIVMLALAALFFLFTISLSVCHVRLITHGQTTVESMQIKDKQEQEEQILARGFGWWECR